MSFIMAWVTLILVFLLYCVGIITAVAIFFLPYIL
ncbi:hypothetical protein EVB61_161 [Rhizobium phage RHph_TM21B]|nr:hypothetical protein EVB61_161 [Rhizobium phage RHph_TM21B]